MQSVTYFTTKKFFFFLKWVWGVKKKKDCKKTVKVTKETSPKSLADRKLNVVTLWCD